MFSGLIPGLNSVNWPDDELSGQIPANLIILVDLPNKFLSFEAYPGTNIATLFTQSLAFLPRQWSEFGVPPEWRALIISIYFGMVIPMVLIALSCYTKEVEEKEKSEGDTVESLDAESPETDVEEGISGSIRDALFNAIGIKTVYESDYTEELCEICFEERDSSQMFTNESCSHSFCYDCTSKHIAAKLQDNIITILCPEADCKEELDFEECRKIIPKDVIVLWDDCLCKSMIPESQRVYCPFLDCLAMLVNDSGEIIEEIECPACQRSICAQCGVPWHSEFECEEFQRLCEKKKGKEDVLVEQLAKKKSWRKCPNCKMYVEKNEGCLHITCRCGYEFCYRCGSKWAKNHGGCSSGQEFISSPSPPPPRTEWDFFIPPHSPRFDYLNETFNPTLPPPPPPAFLLRRDDR